MALMEYQEVHLTIGKYADWIRDHSREYLLWGFSLDKASNFILEKPCVDCLWVVFEMFWKSDLKKASGQLPILVLYYYYLFVIININISIMLIVLLNLSNVF